LSIISVASAQVGYASSKAGVIQFSRVVAVQYAAKGIRVNTVIPGQMHTPMVEARSITGTEIIVDGGMTARCE